MGHHSIFIDFLLPIGLLILVCSTPATATATATINCDFPAVFNFGDSNSDTGGFSATFGPIPPPHGETFFHAPAGRYSDGRLIIDFIAETLGHPCLDAYLNSLATNFSYGANFATAGSTIRRPNTTIFQTRQSPFSLDVQFSQYSQFKSRSQVINKQGVFGSLMPKRDYFSRALYTFDIGQNDLTGGFFHENMTIAEVKAHLVPDVVQQFTSVVKSIYMLGGRHFWVHNTGPFGCLAYFIVRVQLPDEELGKDGCATRYNGVAQYFNEKLMAALQQLRKELPLASITYVDVYTVKYSLISQSKSHGFKEPIKACCGHGGKYNYDKNKGCGSSITVNGTQALVGKSCPDPSLYVSWDGVHYTQAANQWVFNQIASGAYSDPPLPVNMACHNL